MVTMMTLASLLSPAAATPGTARRHWRWAALTLALAAAPLSQAQTLMETLETTSVQNTLNQQGTSSGQAALDRARKLEQTLKGQAVPADAVPGALPAPTTAPTPAAAPAPVDVPAAVTPPPPFSPAQSARLDTARSLLSQGKARDARPIYEGLIALNYQQPEPHFGLALSLLALNDLTGARFELSQFVGLSPESFEGPYNLGVIAVRGNEYDEAFKQFTQAATLSEKASPAARRQVLDALASEQERRQDYAGLSATLTQTLALFPDDAGLKYRLGRAVALSGNGAGALPLLYAALPDAANRTEAALLIADIYAAQELPDRAVRELDSAAKSATNSQRAQLLIRKAQLLQAQKAGKLAVQAAQEAVQADVRSAPAYALLGELLAPDDLAGSLVAWRKAAQLDGKNANIRLNLAAVYLAVQQYADARNNALLTLKLVPESDATSLARARFIEGVSAYRLKDYAAADRALTKSAAASPSAETLLWLGLSRYARRDYEAAITALTESVKLSSTPTARLNLGAALLAAGRFAEAEAHLRSAAVSDPSNAAAWYQLGLSRKAQGKNAEAQTAFTSAARLGYTAAKTELK